MANVKSALIRPEGSLEVLSKREVVQLLNTSQSGLYDLFRRCSLAVLNCGSALDSGKELFESYRNFEIRVQNEQRGVRLEVINAPASAFVDDAMIRGIREHLFAVLRDIVYTHHEIVANPAFDLSRPDDITNAIFHVLRNAGALRPERTPRLAVCWGGHSIAREEYDYTKEVGHELGLRGLDVCTGCGPGAMKGPMKGAAIGHAKQRIADGRYLGVSEPGIIAAEPPNPIVNELVIMPDIEKRLEAFVRIGHAVIVFPGGVGTAEEILYLMGVLQHPDNREIPLPVIFSGPATAESYFRRIDEFLAATLGPEVRNRYRIIIGDPGRVAQEVRNGIEGVREYRRRHNDAYHFNWLLAVDPIFQQPFDPTHDNMAALPLHRDQPSYRLAANLRRAFSGIVAGNVKDEGIRRIEEYGPFEITGDSRLLGELDRLLASFVAERRMKLPGKDYEPCYRIAA